MALWVQLVIAFVGFFLILPFARTGKKAVKERRGNALWVYFYLVAYIFLVHMPWSTDAMKEFTYFNFKGAEELKNISLYVQCGLYGLIALCASYQLWHYLKHKKKPKQNMQKDPFLCFIIVGGAAALATLVLLILGWIGLGSPFFALYFMRFGIAESLILVNIAHWLFNTGGTKKQDKLVRRFAPMSCGIGFLALLVYSFVYMQFVVSSIFSVRPELTEVIFYGVGLLAAVISFFIMIGKEKAAKKV